MNCRPPSAACPAERGIALVIVLVSITVLAVLAGGFAYAMKVEAKLARNVNSEAQSNGSAAPGPNTAAGSCPSRPASPANPTMR